MGSFCCQCPPQTKTPLLLCTMLPVILSRAPSSFSLFSLNLVTDPSLSSLAHPNHNLSLKRSSSRRRPAPPPRSTVEKAEEFDREKAREALQKLDQQLESLSHQEAVPNKSRLSSPYLEPNLEREVITGMRRTEEMPEFSGSYLTYSAVALLILTIFNNIMFNVVIKPSVDGYEQSSPIERVPLSEP